MKLTDANSISKIIKNCRLELGLTQETTAEMCGVGKRFFAGLLPEEYYRKKINFGF